MASVKSLFDSNRSDAVDLSGVKLTEEDLNWLAENVRKHDHVHFIVFKNNETLLAARQKTKVRIQKDLVQNLLSKSRQINVGSGQINDGGDSESPTVMAVDLSKYEIDVDYLKALSDAIDTYEDNYWFNVNLGAKNRSLKTTQAYKKIKEREAEKNKLEFTSTRFPSDNEYAVLASCCRQNDSSSSSSKLAESGWQIEKEYRIEQQDIDYVAILFKNDPKRQLVLAFRGHLPNGQVKDWLGTGSIDNAFVEKLGQQLAAQFFLAYLSARNASEMSKLINYRLSFTGFSFGAWLAQQSLVNCQQEFKHARDDVQAVVFDCPGVGNLNDEINESIAVNLTTYLSRPSFVNTWGEHLGRVYFLQDYHQTPNSDTKQNSSAELNEIVKKTNEKAFYLNAFNSLFFGQDAFEQLSNQFDMKEWKLKRVTDWPQTLFDAKLIDKSISHQILEGKIGYDKLAGIIQKNLTDSFYPLVVSESQDLVLKKFLIECLPCLAMCASICRQVNTADVAMINEPTLDIIDIDVYESTIENNVSKRLNLIDTAEISLEFEESSSNYRLVDPNHHAWQWDFLNLSKRVDSRLFELYFEPTNECFQESAIASEYTDLREEYQVKVNWTGERYERSIKSNKHELTIEKIRDRMASLDQIQENFSKNEATSSSAAATYYFELNDEETNIKTNFEKSLIERIDANLSQRNAVYICGQSGSGKSTLVREYARQKQEASSFDAVYVINFSNSWGSFLLTLADILKVPSLSSKEPINLDLLLTQIHSQMNSVADERKFLFIIDNVDYVELVRPILNESEHENKHKFIICTSQRVLVDSSANPSVVILEPFDKEHFTEYLNSVTSSGSLSNEKQSILREFFDNQYQVKDGLIPKLAELLIRNVKADLVSTTDDLAKFVTDCKFKYELLLAKNLFAFKILKCLAFLNRSSLSVEFVRRMFLDEDQLDASLDYLCELAYLVKRKNSSSSSFEMNEFVQNELLKSNQEDDESSRRRVFEFLSDQITSSNSEQRDVLISHLEALVSIYYEGQVNDAAYLRLLDKARAWLSTTDRPELELNVCMKLSKLYEVTFHKEDPRTVRVYSQLGNIYHARSSYADAIECFEEAIRRCIRSTPINYSPMTASLEHVSSSYSLVNEHEKCCHSLKRCVEAKKAYLPTDHPVLGQLFARLGQVYHGLDKLDAALVYHRESLRVRRKWLQSNSAESSKASQEAESNVASALHQIGLVLMNMGGPSLPQALSSFQEATQVLTESKSIDAHSNQIQEILDITETVEGNLRKPAPVVKPPVAQPKKTSQQIKPPTQQQQQPVFKPPTSQQRQIDFGDGKLPRDLSQLLTTTNFQRPLQPPVAGGPSTSAGASGTKKSAIEEDEEGIEDPDIPDDLPDIDELLRQLEEDVKANKRKAAENNEPDDDDDDLSTSSMSDVDEDVRPKKSNEPTPPPVSASAMRMPELETVRPRTGSSSDESPSLTSHDKLVEAVKNLDVAYEFRELDVGGGGGGGEEEREGAGAAKDDEWKSEQMRKEVESWEKLLETSRQANNFSNIVLYLTWIGVYNQRLGDYKKALSYLNQAFELRRDHLTADIVQAIKLECMIGWTHFLDEDNKQALFWLRKCLERLEQSDVSHVSGSVRSIPARLMARVHEALGENDDAYFCLQQSLEFEQKTSQPDARIQAAILNNIGVISAVKRSEQGCKEALGNFQEARNLLTVVKDTDRELGIVSKNLAKINDLIKNQGNGDNQSAVGNRSVMKDLNDLD